MITFEQMATGTQRIIFTCKNKACKCVWAYDYMVVPAGHGHTTLLRHDASGNRAWMHEEKCPECGYSCPKSNEIIATVTEHKCDAKCLKAKGPVCECSCGGKHHGEGFLRH